MTGYGPITIPLHTTLPLTPLTLLINHGKWVMPGLMMSVWPQYRSLRSGRDLRGVAGLRLGFEQVTFFAAASIPVPRTQDGSDVEDVPEFMSREALEKELAGMRERRAFTLVHESELLTSAWPIDLRFVFNVKATDGKLFDCWKARPVVQSLQRYGIDNSETWAPTGRMMTLRARVAHAVMNKCELWQADITQAFLHGKLDEPMWGRLPDGTPIRIRVTGKGTKLGANAWWRRSVEALQSFGNKRMSADPAAYVAQGERGVRKYIHSHADEYMLVGRPW
jgi:hypothetical protein